MAADREARVIRKSDVPWHRNGIVMKHMFMLTGLASLFGAFVHPVFADFRPGLIDALVGLVLGNLCGPPAGRIMARAYERYTIDRLSLREEMWPHNYDPWRFAYSGLASLAIIGTGAVSAYASSAFGLSYSWVGKVELLSIGGACMGMVLYCISAARVVERWYRSLPD